VGGAINANTGHEDANRKKDKKKASLDHLKGLVDEDAFLK
jgi:hypothetical protein